MDMKMLRAIVGEAKDKTGKLHTSYAALKTIMLERTGCKTNRYEMKLSDEDVAMAKLMAEQLGISVASFYRILAKQAYLKWQLENDEDDEAAEDVAFDEEMRKLHEM